MTSDHQSGASAMRRVRHKKRGSTYRVIAGGIMQTTEPLPDNHAVVVYQSETDGEVWVRPAFEFEDGRFENLPPLPVDPASDALSPALTKSAVEFASLLAADADKPVSDIAKLTRECMDDLGVTPRRIDVPASNEGADARVARRGWARTARGPALRDAVPEPRDAELATLRAVAFQAQEMAKEIEAQNATLRAALAEQIELARSAKQDYDNLFSETQEEVGRLQATLRADTDIDGPPDFATWRDAYEDSLVHSEADRAEIATLRAALEKAAVYVERARLNLSYARQDAVSSAAEAQANKNLAYHDCVRALAALNLKAPPTP